MTVLPAIPLPSGIRSRFVENINGLRMHVLEAGYETKGRPLAGTLWAFAAFALCLLALGTTVLLFAGF